MTTTKTQTENILNYLKEGNSITPIEALNLFGCFRLSARIFDIREMGVEIETTRVVKNGKVFASYKLK